MIDKSAEIDRLLQRACDLAATKLPPNLGSKHCACGWMYPKRVQIDIQAVGTVSSASVNMTITCPHCGRATVT